MQRLPDGRQSRPQRRQPRADGGRRAGRRGSAEESRRPCARRHVLDRWFGELVQPDKLVHRGALGTYRGRLLNDGVSAETIAALTGESPRDLALYRSEEHTSELQSLMRISYAVFCLKKKHLTTNTEH